MMIVWRICFKAQLLCLGCGLMAQDLSPFLQEIKNQNPAYRAAEARLEAAQAQVRVAQTLPDPTVQVGVFTQEVETRVGPQKHRLGVSQVVPWRGVLDLRGQKAEAEAKQARAALDVLFLRLQTQFKWHYAELFYLGQAILLTQDHLRLLTDLEAVITQRYENNSAQYSDLIRIQIEIDNLKDRLETQRRSGPAVVAALNAILGRPSGQAMPYPATLPTLDLSKTNDVQALTRMLRRNQPSLQAFDHRLEGEKAAVSLAAKNAYPDLKFGLDWINTGGAINPDLPDSGQDAIMLSVGLNLPIWRKKYRAQEKSAAHRVEATQLERQDTQNQLEAKLATALFQLDDASRKIGLFQDQIIPKAQESLTVTSSSFQTGESSFLDLIETERALLEFLLSLSKAQAQQYQAATAIEAIVGRAPFEKE